MDCPRHFVDEFTQHRMGQLDARVRLGVQLSYAPLRLGNKFERQHAIGGGDTLEERYDTPVDECAPLAWVGEGSRMPAQSHVAAGTVGRPEATREERQN